MKKSQLKPIIRAIIREALGDRKNVVLPPETPTDNYELFAKKLQGSGYRIPTKDDIVGELRWASPQWTKSWESLAQYFRNMYDDFARYGTNEVVSKGGKKRFFVAADIPGQGWSEIVYAKSEEEAKKIANKKHPGQYPADTAWEKPEDEPTAAPSKNVMRGSTKLVEMTFNTLVMALDRAGIRMTEEQADVLFRELAP